MSLNTPIYSFNRLIFINDGFIHIITLRPITFLTVIIIIKCFHRDKTNLIFNEAFGIHTFVA